MHYIKQSPYCMGGPGSALEYEENGSEETCSSANNAVSGAAIRNSPLLNFYVEFSITGRVKCRRCAKKIEQDTLRFYKLLPNPKLTEYWRHYYHLECFFLSFDRARVTSSVVNKVSELGGFDSLPEEKKNTISNLLEKHRSTGLVEPGSKKPSKRKKNPAEEHKTKNTSYSSVRFHVIHKC